MGWKSLHERYGLPEGNVKYRIRGEILTICIVMYSKLIIVSVCSYAMLSISLYLTSYLHSPKTLTRKTTSKNFTHQQHTDILTLRSCPHHKHPAH